MGNGQGYYDRLLLRVRPDCPLVALCYECQLFDNLIVGPHDVFMDKSRHRKGGVRRPGSIAGLAKRFLNFRFAHARRYR